MMTEPAWGQGRRKVRPEPTDEFPSLVGKLEVSDDSAKRGPMV